MRPRPGRLPAVRPPRGNIRTDVAIASYLRHRSTSRGRASERVGPFLATFPREGHDPVPGFAIPDDWAQPSLRDVEDLVGAYERRSCLPRLRYLSPLAPAVAQVAARAGFGVEDQCVIMTCDATSVAPVPAIAGIELVLPASDAELVDTRAAQRQAYQGSGLPGEEGLRRLQEDIGAGAIAVLARDTDTGQPAGAGLCSIPFGGITETFGIAVAEAYRRRGIARALTVRLVTEALAAGVETVFLVPADTRVERGVYVPAGFARCSQMLQLRLDR